MSIVSLLSPNESLIGVIALDTAAKLLIISSAKFDERDFLKIVPPPPC